MSVTGFLLSLAASFLGSFFALLVWIHWHLEQHWEERRERLRRERATRRRA